MLESEGVSVRRVTWAASLACFSLLLALLLSACGAGQGAGINFHNPVTGYDEFVMPGRVDLLFIPSDIPWSDPNYFDIERSGEEYQVYSDWAYEGYKSDPRLLDFLAAEQLVVRDWWEPEGLEVALPPQTSLEEALTRWPEQYADFFSAVDTVSASGGGYYTPY